MGRLIATTRTLDELDPPAWGEPKCDSYLVTTCHRLRRKPIQDFSVEDLRIMIGQKIGLRWLMPLAVEELERNPLAQGDFYPGDLLASVLSADSFWMADRGLRDRLLALLDQLPSAPHEVQDALVAFRARMA